MRLSRPSSGNRAKLGLIAAVTAALVAFDYVSGFEEVNRRLFDLMSTVDFPRPAQPGAVIVAIDEQSFSAIGKPWPWPRNLHADLIRALRRAGARKIAFDMVFADPTAPDADKALAAAADSRTVFGADEMLTESPQGTILNRTEPLPILTTNGARRGTTSVRVDPDGVLRLIPRYPNSLAQNLLDRPQVVSGDRLIQYFGGARTYPYVSYYQALDPGRYLPPGLLRNQDVLVGLAVQANPEVQHAADMFPTPFTARDATLIPGVEIQATIVDNLRHRLWISPAPAWVLLLLVVAGSAVGLVVAIPDRIAVRLLGIVGAAVAIGACSWLLLRFGRVWVSPAEPLSSVVSSAALLGLVDFAAERKQRRQIQGAFGQYVAPEVVRRLVDDPSLAKLGGERKMITVLFADIRGFTTLSERLESKPEELTRLLNEILSELSAIVIRHGGTIDKYIGDCVMAMWNAPLDDPRHAANAVRAGLEMIHAVSSGPGNISVGVGINSGECVVGNMGSDQRFDYTVIGDPVNVASRLEKLSKDYGVALLVGARTAGLASEEFGFTELGNVRVRGKQASERIYSLDSLISETTKADRLAGGADV